MNPLEIARVRAVAALTAVESDLMQNRSNFLGNAWCKTIVLVVSLLAPMQAHASFVAMNNPVRGTLL